jgi:chemotaxis-related protein WspB
MLLLTFTAGSNRYAVDVVRVVEVVPRVELRALPHAPAFLAGLLAYRGMVVPVIDLGLLLGAQPCQERLSTRIILVNIAPGDHNCQKQDQENAPQTSGQRCSAQGQSVELLGLVAEHVSELTSAAPEQTVPLPLSLPQAPYLGAVVRPEEGIVQLIMVEKLRESVLREVFFEQTVSQAEPSRGPVHLGSETTITST